MSGRVWSDEKGGVGRWESTGHLSEETVPRVGLAPFNISPMPCWDNQRLPQRPPPPLYHLPAPFQRPPPRLPFPPPLDMLSTPPPFDFSCPPPSVFPTLQFPSHSYLPTLIPSNAQDSVDKWVNERRGTHLKHQSKKQNDKPLLSFKISSAKTNLKECSSLIKELGRISKYLSVINKSLPDDDWEKRTKEVINKKVRLNQLLAEFENHPELLVELKKAVSERKRKRVRLQKKRGEWQKHVNEVKIHRGREDQRIDLWLEKMKDEVERGKREDDIKSQADSVLSTVNSNKSQAKMMLSLLNSLSKLRSVRVKKLENSGQSASPADTQAFIQVVGKLKSLWLKRMHEYNKEEECLKLMLSDAEAERTNVELSVSKKLLEEWFCVMFGDPSRSFFTPSTLDQFIALRREWDAFIATDITRSLFSSKIPQGWVVPVSPSDPHWASLPLTPFVPFDDVQEMKTRQYNT